MLALESVFAGYGETVVIESVDFALAPGESLSIIGRNGVGKSSLLATIMGHTTLRGGAIRLAGEDIAGWPTARRNRAGIGYVPQEREVFPSLSVTENLDVAARAGEWSRERVFELFPRLAARRTSRGRQLSGGEQQMLAIGRALMGNPKVLLMDEPSEGLAPVIVEELERVITRLRDESGLAILLVEQHIAVRAPLLAAHPGARPRPHRLRGPERGPRRRGRPARPHGPRLNGGEQRSRVMPGKGARTARISQIRDRLAPGCRGRRPADGPAPGGPEISPAFVARASRRKLARFPGQDREGSQTLENAYPVCNDAASPTLESMT